MAALKKRELLITEDGSHTLFIPDLNEQYHSTHGAVQESTHVFINAGLQPLLDKQSVISVFEVGFGTGLNVLLTLLKAVDLKCNINYQTIEKYPLTAKECSLLNYGEVVTSDKGELFFDKIHNVPWGVCVPISPYFSLRKIEADIRYFIPKEPVDLIYFDAFAPQIQPALWEAEVLQKMYDMLNLNGVLVTYCAKGVVRRRLQSAGFSVERLPGPPGKREMLRATKKG